LRPEIDEFCEHISEVGLRIDAVKLARLDERGNAGPILRTIIVASEERILAIKNDRTNPSFNDVGVKFDATIIKKTGEPIPMCINPPSWPPEHNGLNNTYVPGSKHADLLLCQV
jgi:hypothetical protein